jgi:hypothetical protein
LEQCGAYQRLGLPRSPLKIYAKIAFGLALQAHIAQRRGPFLLFAVVFQTTVLNRLMVAFAYIMENDARALVPGYRKADAVSATGFRHPWTSLSIAQIAEITQLVFRGDGFLFAGMARSGKTCA